MALRVLVVIPSLGERPDMMAEALESVYRQTQLPTEVITAIGKTSLAGRLNAAIASSDCDAFVLLCDDDKLAPNFIEKCAERMKETGADIVYTDCHIFGRRNCRGAALGEWNEKNINRDTVPLITSLCRKSAWGKAGGYVDTAFYDWDFWWRCFYSGATASWLKEPLWWYREHNGQASATENMEQSRKSALERFAQLRAMQ